MLHSSSRSVLLQGVLYSLIFCFGLTPIGCVSMDARDGDAAANPDEDLIGVAGADTTLDGSGTPECVFSVSLSDGSPAPLQLEPSGAVTLTLRADVILNSDLGLPSDPNENPLSDARLFWQIDGTSIFGSLDTHATQSFPILQPGVHSVSLSLELANGVVDCLASQSGALTLQVIALPRLSGTVTNDAGVALSGLTVSATGSGPEDQTTQTDINGQFDVFVPLGWSGTVSVSLAGFQFSPTSWVLAGVTTNQTQDFVGTGGGGGGSPPPPPSGCTSDPECNDGNECTDDICNAGTCENSNTTAGTACSSDGNVCTVDVCDGSGNCGVNNTDPCDDLVFCNGADTCSSGACSVHAGDPCGALTCNETTDACEGCTIDPDCPDDGNVCTETPTCDTSGICVYAPSNNTTSCNDGNPCTENDLCDGAGSCTPGGGKDCSAFDDVCNLGACNLVSGVCEAQPANEGGACDDGNACTVADSCGGGACVSRPPLDCDDGDPCTTDSCDPVAGCQSTDPCSIATPLTPVCDAGTCVECLDNNDCAPGAVCVVQQGVAVCQLGAAISGKLTLFDGSDAVGVDVIFTGSGTSSGVDFTVTTDASGNSVVVVPDGWSGTATSDTNHRLEPPSRTFTAITADSVSDFVAFRNYYVATTGSDSNPGTQAMPFVTILHAADITLPGDTVYMRGGTHSAGGRSSARVPISRSGTPAAQITFQNYANESVVIDGLGQVAFGISISPGTGHLVFRGLTIRNFRDNGFVSFSGHHMLIESCTFEHTTRPDSGGGQRGMHLLGNPGTEYVTIRDCVFRFNGKTGFMAGNKSTGSQAHYILVENSVAHDNGFSSPAIGGEGFIAQAGDADGLGASMGLTHHITFRNCIAYRNSSDQIVVQDVHHFTAEDCIVWRAAPDGVGDGDLYKWGLHWLDGSIATPQAPPYIGENIMRRCVGFTAQHHAFQLSSLEVAAYQNTVFDVVPRSFDSASAGWRHQSGDGIYRNNVAFDATPLARDAKGNVGNIDSNFNYWADGTTLAGEGPDTMTEASDGAHQLDGAAANVAADAFSAAATQFEQNIITRAQFDSAKAQLMTDMRSALTPGTGPLVNTGTFLVFTTSAAPVATTDISVDRDPREFFRPPSNIPTGDTSGLGIEFHVGDLIQVNGASPATARVVSMTVDNITVDTAMTFGNAAGVSIPWNGSLPDRGAYESSVP